MVTDLTDQRLSNKRSNDAQNPDDNEEKEEEESPEKTESKQAKDDQHHGENEEELTIVRDHRRKTSSSDISRYNSNASLDSISQHPHVAATMAMTRAETRVLRRWKLLLVLVLLFSMIFVGLAVYFFMAKSEQQNFELQFAQDADKVLEALGDSLDLTLKAVDALAVGMVVRLEIQKFKNTLCAHPTTVYGRESLVFISHLDFFSTIPLLLNCDLEYA
jgi:hypothetical protein